MKILKFILQAILAKIPGGPPLITHKSLKKTYTARKNALSQAQRNHLERALKQCLSDTSHHIPEEDGFLITQMKDADTLMRCLKFCEEHWPKSYIEREISKPSKNDTLLAVAVDIFDPDNACVKELALSPEIIGAAARYLGDVPVLSVVSAWYCPNRTADELVGSQMFHCDREGHKQVKVFIPIEEIRPVDGPTTCLSAAATKRYFDYRRSRYETLSLKNRFSDQDVHQHGSDEEHPLTGAPGTLAFVDTTNCLHYGSRPGERGKYHMVLQYTSPFFAEPDPAIFTQDTESIILSRLARAGDSSPYTPY